MLNEFLMNIPFDGINFMSYASYRHLLRKWSILDQNQIALALSIKNCGIQLKKVGDDQKMKKRTKNWKVKNH